MKCDVDFAYFFASIICSTKDFFRTFDWSWYEELKKNFIAFRYSVSGRLLHFFNKNFFVDLFELSAETSGSVFKSIGSVIKFNFGYGNPDSFTNQIKDLFGGSFQLFDSEKLSFGVILNSEKWGVYFTGFKNSYGNIFSNATFELAGKHPNFDWFSKSPFPVLVDDYMSVIPSFDTGQYGPIIWTSAIIMIIIFGLTYLAPLFV